VRPPLITYFQQKMREGQPQVRIDIRSFGGVAEYLNKIGRAVPIRIETERDRVVFGLIDYYVRADSGSMTFFRQIMPYINGLGTASGCLT